MFLVLQTFFTGDGDCGVPDIHLSWSDVKIVSAAQCAKSAKDFQLLQETNHTIGHSCCTAPPPDRRPWLRQCCWLRRASKRWLAKSQIQGTAPNPAISFCPLSILSQHSGGKRRMITLLKVCLFVKNVPERGILMYNLIAFHLCWQFFGQILFPDY